jgi:hypothetical protein
LYISGNFFAYLLLLKRAQAVEGFGSYSPHRRLFAVILVLVKLGTALVPFIALGSILLFEGQVLFAESKS